MRIFTGRKMKIKTTTIGAYPKPEYLPAFDWFSFGNNKDVTNPTEHYDSALETMGNKADELFEQAVKDVISDQEEAGIDILTDGEVKRENYIHYHCRHLDGIDFHDLTEKAIRGGTYTPLLPTITGPVRSKQHFLPNDWKIAQKYTKRTVKMTLPGPMTLGDTVADKYYENPKKRGSEIASALNKEVLALVDAGCTDIQIDEPLFARRVQDALDYGFGHLESCFEGVPDNVTRTVHMCCGYPDRLDNFEYPKAPKECYFELAEAIDSSSIDAISIEDAHRQNDLSLLDPFKYTTVIFGVVSVAVSRIETVKEITDRLTEAIKHIDAERIIAAPDCGLGLLNRDLAMAKLKNLCQAARDI